MITSTQMYWLTRMDGINGIFVAGIFLSVLCSIAAIFLTHIQLGWDADKEEKDDVKNKTKKIIIRGALLFIFFILGSVFVPNTKEVAVIYCAPAIINNQDVQALPSDLVKLARQQIESMMKPKDIKTESK